MKKYRKIPVVIDAVELKFTPYSIKKCLEFMGQKVNSSNYETDRRFDDYVMQVSLRGFLEINTLEGPMKASEGDFIIRGINGEYYPCKPDIFKKTYEEII